MSHLTWLHLSDWHQKVKDFDRGVVRDKLIEDLQNRAAIDPRLPKIDFVVFSGDLADVGDPKEFEAAREGLLDPVLSTVGLTPDRLFIVPGNHDLQRYTITKFLPVGLQKPLETPELVNEWLTDEKGLKHVLDPFEAYIKFVGSYTGQPEPAFASVNRTTFNGVDVAILGLNSAWMCARNKRSDGEVDDYGHLVVGELQIHEPLQKINDATVRIAVLHHPFNWLEGFEQSNIQKRLKATCHFILRGHEHQPDADLSKGTQGECVIIPAGASYNRRNANNMLYVNAYNFVHLDLANAKGVVFFRRWSEGRTKWIEDIETVEGGQLDFLLPKQLGSSSPKLSQVSSLAATPDQSALEDDYRNQTIEAFKNLSFKGLTASVRPILLPLKKVYVQLRAVAEVPESADEFTPEERRVLRWMDEEREGAEQLRDLREAQMRLDALRRERWTKDRLERFPISDALKDPKRRGLVILGDPGSGKTTLLHFLALMFAHGPQAASEFLKLTGDEADRLPIFAPLAAYDDMLNHDAGLTVQNFLAKYYAQRKAIPGLENLFNSAIEKGRALVLLDGMDEVLEEGRRKFVADQASAFIRALIHRGNRVLLTSRIYGYRVAPLSVDLPHVTVLDFRREEIEVFAKQWNSAMVEWEYSDRKEAERAVLASDQQRALLEEIQSNPGVERLAANPLLLSMLALLRRQVGRLPQQRIRLYSLYLGTLIDAWEASRSPGARVDSPVRPEAGRVELVLIPLALWLQQNKPSGTATEAEILAQIIAVFLREEGLSADTHEDTPEWREAYNRAQKFLQDMRRYSGLLVERGQGVFGFRHLTFQEYYVGRALARMSPTQRWKLLQSNLHANRWREPILLAAAQLGNMQADEEACTILVNQILDAGSPHEDILHRDLFLAADCAADDINVHIKTLRRIVDELKALISSSIPAIVSGAVQRVVNLALLFSSGKPRLPETIDILRMAVPSDPSSKVLALEKFGPLVRPLLQSSPAISESLIDQINKLDDYSQGEAIRALSGVLPESRLLREFVINKLKDDEEYFGRAGVIGALGGLVPQDETLLEVLERKLEDKWYLARGSAIQVLAPSLASHPRLIEKITEKLNDADPTIRIEALKALSPLLPNNERLRNAVALALDDDDYSVPIAAVRALAGVLSEHKTLRDQVAEKLNGFGDLCVAAIEALTIFLPQDETLRSTVTQLVDYGTPSVIIAAIRALAGNYAHDLAFQEVVKKKLDHDSPLVREAAIQALLKSEQPERVVLRLLQHADWHTRRDTVFAMVGLADNKLVESALAEVLTDLRCPEAIAVHAAVVLALGKLMGDDDSVREEILAKLEDESYLIREAAVKATSLWLPDPLLRDAVTQKLRDGYPSIRMLALQALTPFLRNNELLMGAFKEVAEDIFSDITTTAVQALLPVLPSDEVLPFVKRLLKHDSFIVREGTILSLAPLVQDDETIREIVVQTLDDESDWVRAAAVQVLGPSLPNEYWKGVLARFSSKENNYGAGSVLVALSKLVPNNPLLAESLKEMLSNPDEYVRSVAIRTLAPSVSSNESVRDAVEELLRDQQLYMRVQAINALGESLLQESALRERVAEMLDDPDKVIRAAAVDTLAGTLSHYESLRVAVVRRLNDSGEEVRVNAIRALAAFLSGDQQLREAVARRLEDESPAVRMVAAEALTPFVSEQHFRPRLRALFGADDGEILRYARPSPRQALVKSWSESVLPEPDERASVISMVVSEDWRLRLSGVEILTAGGKEFVREAVPQLREAMNNYDGLDSFAARVAAAEALINRTNHSKDSLQVLISALDYGAPPLMIVPMATEIRTSAAVALGKLKAEEYQPEAVSKLREFMQTERDPQVLDGLYNAILSLASAPMNVEV